MVDDVLNPRFWKDRIEKYDRFSIQSIYEGVSHEQWDSWAACHRSILNGLIQPNDSVLDVGCSYGRVLDLLPSNWKGKYVGIDVSPDYIEGARLLHPNKEFYAADIRHWEYLGELFDWTIMLSFKYMIIRNSGQSLWDEIEHKVKAISNKLLFLEFDVTDTGTIEENIHG